MAILLFQEGIKSGQVFEIGDKELTVGRHQTNDIILSDPLTSRYHSKIVKKEDDIYLFDLDSHNGTCVNGLQIKIKKLSMKDSIKIGKSIMVILNKIPDILEEQEALENLVQDKVADELPKIFGFDQLPGFERLNPAKYTEITGNYNLVFIMNKINSIFALKRDIKEIFAELSSFLCNISGADRVYFTGYNSLKKVFSPLTGSIKANDTCEKIEDIHFIKEFYDKLVDGYISVWLKDTDMSKSFKESNEEFIKRISSCMCFPVAYKQKILGIIQFDYFNEKEDIKANFIYQFNRVCPVIAYNILSRN